VIPEFGETVTIITRAITGHDADGNDVFGDVSTDIPNSIFAPAGSTEKVQGEDVVTIGATVYLPDGTPTPKATDRVSARGDLYEIDGDPQVYSNPFTGDEPGAVLRLLRVTG